MVRSKRCNQDHLWELPPSTGSSSGSAATAQQQTPPDGMSLQPIGQCQTKWLSQRSFYEFLKSRKIIGCVILCLSKPQYCKKRGKMRGKERYSGRCGCENGFPVKWGCVFTNTPYLRGENISVGNCKLSI